MVTAINKKHQATVNRFVKADAKYDALVDKHAAADNETQRAADAEADIFNTAFEIIRDLPKREVANIAKTIDISGYGR